MANAPWPDNLASKMLASYIGLTFRMSPGAILFRNPPMGAMPFFNNSASSQIREAELGLIAGDMLEHFIELQIPLEAGKSSEGAHAELVTAMLRENAPSSGMSVAINNNFRFRDEA